MTARKESSDEKEGILEKMLQSLKTIGQNVEEILDRFEAYADGTNRRYDNEWSVKDLYNNGDY